MRDIGKNIRALRMEKGMTQDALAEALFVTRQTVSNYETGRSRPDVDMLLQIAQVLETDANTVLYGRPMPESKKNDYIRLAVGLGIFTVLLVAYYVLLPICQEIRNTRFDLVPQALLVLFLRPAWMLMLGWVILQSAAAVTNVTRIERPWIKYVRWGLLGLLAVIMLLVLPFVLWLVEGMILRNYQNEVSHSYHHFWIDSLVMDMLMKQPWVMIVFGGGLWLSGFPQKRKKTKEQTEEVT